MSEREKLLEAYREFVLFICNDYTELSYDKIEWQRNDWKRRANKLREVVEPLLDRVESDGEQNVLPES